jgi:transaldolase
MQWSELVGGDVVISPPYKWQVRFNGSDVNVAAQIDKPVDPEIVDELLRKFPDFRRAYNEDGLSVREFDTYGPTVRTLRQFLEATHELAVRVRDLLLPNPDGSSS